VRRIHHLTRIVNTFECRNLISISFLIVCRLKEEEAKLEKIVKEQGGNVETFVGLVEDNGKTLQELKVRLCFKLQLLQCDRSHCRLTRTFYL